jgi:hypothetical protein
MNCGLLSASNPFRNCLAFSFRCRLNCLDRFGIKPNWHDTSLGLAFGHLGASNFSFLGQGDTPE